MRLGNELKIGITVVLAIVVGFVGFRVMKDAPIFRMGTVYYVEYAKVDGLSIGTTVLVSGIKIGSVQKLELMPSDSVRVTINLNVPDGLPEGSSAIITSVDLLGSKAIEIERGNSSEMIPYGGFIHGIYDEGMFAELADTGSEISTNITESTVRVNSLLSEIEAMFKEGGRADIEGTLGNLQRTTGQVDELISETRSDIAKSLESLESMLSNLEELTSEERGEIQRTIKNLEVTSVELQEMSVSLKDVSANLAQIMQKINDGEGTLGKLVNDSSLYNNLDTLTLNVNRLVQDINENPRHFLRHIRLVDVF